MNIWRLYRGKRDAVQLKLDELIMECLSRDEQIERRIAIMHEFDDMLDKLQAYHDELVKVKETNEFLKATCCEEEP